VPEKTFAKAKGKLSRQMYVSSFFHDEKGIIRCKGTFDEKNLGCGYLG